MKRARIITPEQAQATGVFMIAMKQALADENEPRFARTEEGLQLSRKQEGGYQWQARSFVNQWQRQPDVPLPRALVEHFLNGYINDGFRPTWLRHAALLSNSERDHCFSALLENPEKSGLAAFAAYLTKESLQEVEWWKHPTEGGEYAFYVDFAAAWSLVLNKLSFLSPDSPGSLSIAAEFVVSQRYGYIDRWRRLVKSEMGEAGPGKATAYAQHIKATAMLWDFFAVPLRFFTDAAAVGLLGELGLRFYNRDAELTYRDSIRNGPLGLRKPAKDGAIVRRWSPKNVTISPAAAKTAGVEVSRIEELLGACVDRPILKE